MAKPVLWDSGIVAGGAVITSPVLDIGDVNTILMLADNTAGGAGRNTNLQMFLDDGVTAIALPTANFTVNAGLRAVLALGPSVSAANLSGAWTIVLSRKIQVSLAAGGAANGRLTLFGI